MKIWFRRFLLRGFAAAAVLLAAAGVVLDMAGERVLRPVAEGVLERMTGTGVEFDHIDFDLSGKLDMKGLCFGGGREQFGGVALAEADEVDVVFAGGLWGSFKGIVESVEIDGLDVNLARGEDGVWNFAGLDMRSGGGDGGRSLESLLLKDVRLRAVEVGEDGLRDIAAVRVGRSDLTLEDDGVYAFSVLVGETGKRGAIGGRWDTEERKVTVATERVGGPDVMWLGNCVDVEGLDAAVRYGEGVVSIDGFAAELCGGAGKVSVSGDIRQVEKGTEVDLAVRAEDLVLSESRRAGALVYGEGLSEKIGGGVEKVFDKKYRPEGAIDLTMNMRGGSWERKRRISGTVELKGISATYYKFPYRLDDVQGEIAFGDGGAEYPRIEGRHGDVEVVISGQSERTEEGIRFATTVRSPNMELGEDLYSALRPRDKAKWFEFAPRGRISLVQEISGVRREEDDEPIEKHERLEVELLGVDVVYQDFPYPLEGLRGRMVVEDGAVRLEDVACESEVREDVTKRVRINGRIGKDREGVVNIDADNVPMDEKLWGAFEADRREFYKQFRPSGLLDADIKVLPGEGEDARYEADLHVGDGGLMFERYGLELAGVEIGAKTAGDDVVIERLAGRDGDAEFEVAGRIDGFGGDQAEYALQVSVKGVDVAGGLAERVSDEAAEVVEMLGAAGKVDLRADVDSAGDGEYSVRVSCDGVSVEPAGTDFAARGIRGDVVVEPGRIVLDDVRGEYGKAGEMWLDGEMVREDGKLSGGELAVAMEGGTAGELPLGLLGDGAVEIASELSGAVDVHLDPLRFGTGEKGKRWYEFGGQAELGGAEFVLGESDVTFDGLLSGAGRYETEAGFVRFDGAVGGDRLVVSGRAFTNVRGDFMLDAKEGELVCEDLRADVYGGKVEGAVSLGFGDDQKGPGYSMRLDFAGVNASEFVQRSEDKAAGGKGFRGVMSGSVGVSGTLGEEAERMGRLKVEVRDMRLARRSFFGKVLTAMQFSEPTDYVFDRVSVDSYLRDDVMVFEEVLMIGEANVLRGRGSLAMDTQRVDLTFTAFGTDVKEDPSMMESLARGLGGAIARVDVRGKLEDPEIETETFPVLKGPFDIFGGQ
ncbi:putative protein involved in outer membrane biogenesis [Anaerohalosphaera lusitana]|uniref:Uncharacterized protein n=1 Tax=Anaerohalosphaera lusitana TaxID=1936003 RepID=A0A1U9NGJ8_9BACT|nr:AsmA-like C-terminal region-containing protein [Anaerohalosphaera lusitana]AQT67062.1 putative protein involved in outer membrane biogenesis [Anaerohalosphaera lusitana]